MKITIPPLAKRLADGRPVLTKEQVMTLAERVMTMSSSATVSVRVTHIANVITRLANGQVMSSDDGDAVEIHLRSSFQGIGVSVITNQVDDSVLQALVQKCDMLAKAELGSERVTPVQPTIQDATIPVNLWHEETIGAMTTSRRTVIPEILNTVTRQEWQGKPLNAAGFIGLTAKAQAYISKEGLSYYNEETDSEVTVTARTADFKGSGWAGRANRDWSKVNYIDVANKAAEFARMSANPYALEPGRRTAILSPTALVQIARFLAFEYHAFNTDYNMTGFSKIPKGNKLGQKVFDSRISMISDPADPDGGYCPWFMDAAAYGTRKMQWVENGVLKNLSYDTHYGLDRGKPYSQLPFSIRLTGGNTSIEEMISRCKDGIYVNRFSSLDLVDKRTGLITGVTRDGCFLVRDGKINRAVKNFRFLDSPFFFLNSIEALGVPERAAFGYTPKSEVEWSPYADWPRQPIIVPPVMVRDFNFSALADAI